MFTLAQILADSPDWDGHMGWGGGWWMFVSGTVMMGGFIFLLAWTLRSVGATPTAMPQAEPPADAHLKSAQTILAERYASGELSSEDYHERLRNLTITRS